MKRVLATAAAVLLGVSCAKITHSNDATTKSPAPATKQESRAKHPGETLLSIEGAPAKGNPDAAAVVVEFGDFQCPVCARHMVEIMPQLEEHYVRAGKIRYVFRDFPLLPIHPRAFPAAVAARCAGDQGKFWEMHDRLLANQSALSDDALPTHAQALGLDVGRFRKCLGAGKHHKGINDDLEEGMETGVKGTPTFIVGVPVPGSKGTIKVVEIIPGVGSYSGFSMVINRVLREKATQSP